MPEEVRCYEKGLIYRLKLDELQPDPNQPRKYIDEEALKELENSIKQHGILQPILFRVDEKGQTVIVAGERRYQASKNIGAEEVPALLVEGKHVEIALVENLLRQNLTPMEEAEALQQMKDEFSYSESALSKVLCKGKSTICEILSLNRLPKEIREECRRSLKIPRDKLVEIAKLEKTEDMAKVYEKVKSEDLSRKEIRQLKKELKEESKIDGNEASKKDKVQNEGSKDTAALMNHADKLIDIVWKMKDSISDEVKARLQELVKEIEKVIEK